MSMTVANPLYTNKTKNPTTLKQQRQGAKIIDPLWLGSRVSERNYFDLVKISVRVNEARAKIESDPSKATVKSVTEEREGKPDLNKLVVHDESGMLLKSYPLQSWSMLPEDLFAYQLEECAKYLERRSKWKKIRANFQAILNTFK